MRKTLENPELWYPINKYGAGWLMLAGVMTVFCAIGLAFVPGLSLDVYAELCPAVFAVVLTVGLAMTIRFMNRL